MNRPKKILIRGSNWLGDAVMSLPAILALKQKYQDIEMDVLTLDKIAALYKYVPGIDRILVFARPQTLLSRFKKAREISAGGYSHAVILPNSFDSALVPFLARIPNRCGFRGQWRSLLLTRSIKPPVDFFREHHSLHYFRIICEAGLEVTPSDCVVPNPLIKVSASEMDKVHQDLSSLCPGLSSTVVGFCPGAEYGPSKKWPVKKFRWLAQKILLETNASVIILGTPSEKPDGDLISEDLAGCFNLAGKTHLDGFIRFASLCRLLVTNDSGAMHVGGALGVPVMAIFGSTEPKATVGLGPVHVFKESVTCSPCLERTCKRGDYLCLEKVSEEAVWNKIRDYLINTVLN